MTDTGLVESRPRQPIRTQVLAAARAVAAGLAPVVLAAAVLAVPAPAPAAPVTGAVATEAPLRAGATAATASYGIGAPIPFPLFPVDNAWNTPVDKLPLDPDWAAYINPLSPGTGCTPISAPYGTRKIGIPYVVVSGGQTMVPIHFVEYGDESDPGPYPVPGTRLSRAQAAPMPTATGTCWSRMRAPDALRLYPALPAAGRFMEYRLRRGLESLERRAEAEQLDIRRRGRAADLPRPGRYDEIVTARLLDHAFRFTAPRAQSRLHPPRDALRLQLDQPRPLGAADGSCGCA